MEKRTHFCKELKRELIGKRVKVNGWVQDVRNLGSLLFITLKDVSGFAQAVFNKLECSKEVFKLAEEVKRQSCVSIAGTVKETKAKGLEVEIKAEDIKLISEAEHPLPVDPTGRVPASIDVRLNARALDLRNPANTAIFKIRSKALQAIRKVFLDKGFFEVNTPKIIGAGAEGGATLFKVNYFGNTAYLAQSPQLYKEQLTASLERVFEIADFFRAEKSSTRRHLSEFISIDVEAAYWDENDVMSLAEDIIIGVTKAVLEECEEEFEILNYKPPIQNKPFPRITYLQAVKDLQDLGIDIEQGDDLKDEHLKILEKRHKGYYFIVDWPAKLKPFYIEKKNEELSYSFDLQYGYLEIASGGRRVSKKEVLEERLKGAGVNLEAFKDHLRAFEWGMPPHSGWGMGFDRLMMVLTGRSNIREVVLYPRDRFRLTP
jgi:aspartyl-tRNA synthetase